MSVILCQFSLKCNSHTVLGLHSVTSNSVTEVLQSRGIDHIYMMAEFSTIVNCDRKLEIALKSDREIAKFLLQQGFITQELYDDINDPRSNLTDAQKARMLVTAIRDRVELNPRNYHILVDYLCQNRIRYGDIIDILHGEYNACTGPAIAHFRNPQAASTGPEVPDNQQAACRYRSS